MQTITLKEVISANKRALKKGTLGCVTNSGEGCRYDYGNGSRCAIGQVLTKTTLAAVHAAHDNDVSVSKLVEDKLIRIAGTKRQKNIVELLQNLHDKVGKEMAYYGPTDGVPAEFATLIDAACNKITLNVFKVALALAEKYA